MTDENSHGVIATLISRGVPVIDFDLGFFNLMVYASQPPLSIRVIEYDPAKFFSGTKMHRLYGTLPTKEMLERLMTMFEPKTVSIDFAIASQLTDTCMTHSIDLYFFDPEARIYADSIVFEKEEDLMLAKMAF